MENSQEAFTSKFTEVVQNPNQLKEMRKSLIDYTYDNESIFKEFVNAIEGKL